MIRKIQYVAVLFMLLVSFIQLSCSRTKPVISYGFLHMVLYQAEPKPREQLSLFIMVVDDDGVDNLDELYVYHDIEQLRWLIKSDEWVQFEQDGHTWIGTRNLALQDDQSLPRGVYRAVLVNKGGEKTERSFSFDFKEQYPFPELIIESGQYSIKSEWPNNKFVCYDTNGNFITTIEVKEREGSVSALKLPSSVRTAALWAEDAEHFYSAFTYIVPTR